MKPSELRDLNVIGAFALALADDFKDAMQDLADGNESACSASAVAPLLRNRIEALEMIAVRGCRTSRPSNRRDPARGRPAQRLCDPTIRRASL